MKTFIVLKRLPVTEGDKADKMGPQVKALVTTLTSMTVPGADGKTRPIAAGDRVERQDLIKALTSGNALTTRQTPDRILSFYQPKLKELGLIDIVKEAEPKPEKPAKAAAAPTAQPAKPAKGVAEAAAAGASPAQSASAAKPAGATA